MTLYDNGHLPSGKAQDFDSCIRWFESNMPSSHHQFGRGENNIVKEG